MRGSDPQSSNPATFPTDYKSILDRVYQIDPLAYGRTRNFIDGAVTYLSPYISRGVLSVKQVLDITLARGLDRYEISKFIQELAWREYFQRVWQAKGDSLFTDLRQPQPDVGHRQMINSIADATTGIDAVDDAIRGFYETGYLHNHVRMYIASIACNVGRAHWSTPSRWMYTHLLDGDLASNACSWQWVAGAFSGKKYWCDQANINRHTHSIQHGTFLDVSLDELPRSPIPSKLIDFSPWNLETTLPSTNVVSINPAKPTLIYNSYNLDPEWRLGEDVNRVLLLEPSHFRKFPVSQRVLEFIVSLSKNLSDLQVVAAEVDAMVDAYGTRARAEAMLISKEHPLFHYYPGKKDPRDWMYPDVSGYFPSFSKYWQRCMID